MSWELPESAIFRGQEYRHRADFREILKLLALLGNEEKPEYLRWYAGLSYFFYSELPEELAPDAMEYLSHFLTAGQKSAPGPRLYDWEHDAQRIAAGVNAVAGFEVRSARHLHWWTFLGYFQSMGEGQFSLVVGIREKLRKGQKLEAHEQEFYRAHKEQVRLPAPDSPQKRHLEGLLRSN